MHTAEYQASEFGKVAVLMGGQSAERTISLESGQAVHTALCNVGIDAHTIDYDKNTFHQLINDDFDRVFIALHGRGGEDGTIQGALDSIGMPYTGSNVLGSALALDKTRCKAIWRDSGLATPAAIELTQASNWGQIAEQIGMPIMVKPVREGSSLGASKVTQAELLSSAWEQANQFDDRVMAESWIEGDEYTVSILSDIVLPLIKLETTREFYDYKAKYEDQGTKYICPCKLDEDAEQTLAELSLQACQLLGVSGWSRIDLMIDATDQAWLIEVNTVPGMTSHSLVPMAAKQAGISFEQLAVQILATSMIFPVSKELQN
ncbi:MAG: D-alanine--D-alanine ligase [Proteobacteria bacterium]|nr:D-alanine--D-alanine ligase [Pseudomonadota bacterium]